MRNSKLAKLKRYQAVFFDFWHTIAVFPDGFPEEIRNNAYQRMQKVLHDFGFSVQLETFKTSLENALLRKEEMAKEGLEVSSWLSIAKVLDELGIPWEGPIVALLRKEYRNHILESGLTLKEGTEEILAYLKDKDIKVALLSNTSQGDLERKFLEKFGLLRYFDALFFSSEEGYRKPRVEIFEEALSFFGIEPCAVLHVGDLVELDLLGARNAGIDSCIIKSQTDEEYKVGGLSPDFLITDLRELIKIL